MLLWWILTVPSFLFVAVDVWRTPESVVLNRSLVANQMKHGMFTVRKKSGAAPTAGMGAMPG
jgi:hypothetical protein